MNVFEKNIDEKVLRNRVNQIQFEFSELDWELFENNYPELDDNNLLEYPIKKQNGIKILFAIGLIFLAVYAFISVFNSDDNSSKEKKQEDTLVKNSSISPNDSLQKIQTIPLDKTGSDETKEKNKSDDNFKKNSKKINYTENNNLKNDTSTTKAKERNKKKKRKKKKKSEDQNTQ